MDPLLAIGRQSAFVGQPLAAIQRDPIHDFRIDKMGFPVAHLPDACVRTLPILADPVQAATDPHPHIVGDRADIFVIEVERVHEFTVNIRLELGSGRIADANRSGFAVSLPVIHSLLRNLGLALYC